jgi:hypothetical protein
MKRCGGCRQHRPLEAFHRGATRCRDCKREYDRQRNATNKRERQDRARLRRYGLTALDFDRLWSEQGGRCGACAVTMDDSCHVDHDHRTGAVRALLCGPCNLALGHAGEDPDRLRAVADYAERWGAPSTTT